MRLRCIFVDEECSESICSLLIQHGAQMLILSISLLCVMQFTMVLTNPYGTLMNGVGQHVKTHPIDLRSNAHQDDVGIDGIYNTESKNMSCRMRLACPLLIICQ